MLKSIKLTEEQERRLTHMVRALFPEYTLVSAFFGGRQRYAESFVKRSEVVSLPYKKITNDGESFEFIDVHWFEFCNTWLLEKILNPEPTRPNRGLKEAFGDYFWNTNLWWQAKYINGTYNTSAHPIDFLYSIFVVKHINNKK